MYRVGGIDGTGPSVTHRAIVTLYCYGDDEEGPDTAFVLVATEAHGSGALSGVAPPERTVHCETALGATVSNGHLDPQKPLL